MAASIATVKSELKTLVSGVSGVSRVETKPGGPGSEPLVPWALVAKPGQSFWRITGPVRWTWRDVGLGGASAKEMLWRIEGWMPRVRENPDSTPTWQDLVDGVRGVLRNNRSLAQKVWTVRLPVVRANAYVSFGDGVSDPRECHYALIELLVGDWVTYTSS